MAVKTEKRPEWTHEDLKKLTKTQYLAYCALLNNGFMRRMRHGRERVVILRAKNGFTVEEAVEQHRKSDVNEPHKFEENYTTMGMVIQALRDKKMIKLVGDGKETPHYYMLARPGEVDEIVRQGNQRLREREQARQNERKAARDKWIDKTIDATSTHPEDDKASPDVRKRYEDALQELINAYFNNQETGF